MKKNGIKQIVWFLAGLCLLGITGCRNKDSALAVRANRNGTQSVILPGYTENTLGAFLPEFSPSGDIKAETGLKTAAPAPEDPAGPGGTEAGEPLNAAGELPARRIQVDPAYTARNGEVVEIREKMFIAQVNDVYLNPEDYLGKTLKLEGLFQTQSYYGVDPYYFVIRYGPGCCGNDGNAGFEVFWDGSFLEGETFQEKTAEGEPVYPEEGDWVEAVGVLGAYEEDGYPYLCIALSSLKVLEERGAEFVTQ